MRPASLPRAHIARQAGASLAPPREPLRRHLDRVVEPVRTTLGYLVAFWPLTATMLAGAALLWAAGYHAGP
jgi:hypothetical protein